MVILYGLPHSLYTGKVRAYLRKRGLAYVERSPAHPDFRAEVVPRIGRAIIAGEIADGAKVTICVKGDDLAIESTPGHAVGVSS